MFIVIKINCQLRVFLLYLLCKILADPKDEILLFLFCRPTAPILFYFIFLIFLFYCLACRAKKLTWFRLNIKQNFSERTSEIRFLRKY